MYNTNMDNNTIDEKKLAEAKEKLACHIMPPGQHDDTPDSPWMKAMADAEKESVPSDASNAASGGSQTDFITADGRVLLTQMTTAGG